MDDSQTAFAAHYPSYGFDLDMMKRSMDTVGGPDAKKARWSPTFSSTNASSALTTTSTSGTTSTSTRDAFANYGYGPHAAISQSFQPSSSPAFTPNALYSTPSLTINTAVNGHGQTIPMSAQMSPHTGTGFAQQQQGTQQGQNGAGAYGNAGSFGYGMLGMGLPSVGMLGGFPYSSQSGNFGQQGFNQQPRLPSLNVNIPPTPGAYSPAALSAVISANPNATSRTVYVGNLPATASVDELLNLVHFGPLESIRVLPEKSCVFLSFLDGATAASFHADATIKKLSLHGQELKIGWGKPSPVSAQVQLAIQQSNASRNVYLGGLDEGMTEEMLRDELSRFGLIDQVKIVRDKNIGFVHFLSISVATKVVNTLPTEPAWAGKRVNYGKDRCAYIPKSQQAAAQAAQAAAAQSLVAQSATLSPASATPFGAPFTPYSPFPPDGMGMGMGAMGGAAVGMPGLNRTVYLGNIHPETTTEDLCNAIRGGVLQSIRYMQDKHIAFVTFVDPAAAFTFFQVSSYQGLTLNNRRLKVGWGKNSGPLPPSLALAVHSGATRNVYVGNIEDFELFGEEKLKRDFGEYGDIELVNFLKEKNCAFVNFTNISNAIKAIDGVKNKSDYANLRIAHGKDRCANPPRSGPQGGSASKRSTSGTSGAGAGAGANEVEVGEEIGGIVDGVGEENGVAGPGPEIQEMRVDGTTELEGINGTN
ncbi:hypothetical protein F5I97DRAFT_230858 [Phlebopus sp. FC_14]|nr:hypothetical protein F5I97DRAFT_230858 [Phlebopus sp. FC_14]